MELSECAVAKVEHVVEGCEDDQDQLLSKRIQLSVAFTSECCATTKFCIEIEEDTYGLEFVSISNLELVGLFNGQEYELEG